MLIFGVKRRKGKWRTRLKKKKKKKKDEESLKGQEKKENGKYLHFILNLFDDYTVLRRSFWY